MQEGMEIDGARDEAVSSQKKRGPKPGAKRNPVRPPIQSEVNVASVRPKIKHDSARDAEDYANKILEGLGGSFDERDEFYIDPALWPDGWVYEWKAFEVAGKPNDYHMVHQKRLGWRSVDASRHPEIMPEGSSGPIVKKGLMLMETPGILVDRMKKKQLSEARGQLQGADQLLHETPAHTAPRDEFPEKMKIMKREVMRPVQQDGD